MVGWKMRHFVWIDWLIYIFKHTIAFFNYLFWNTSVVAATLIKSSFVSLNKAWNFTHEGKVGLPYQRSITKYPQITSIRHIFPPNADNSFSCGVSHQLFIASFIWPCSKRAGDWVRTYFFLGTEHSISIELKMGHVIWKSIQKLVNLLNMDWRTPVPPIHTKCTMPLDLNQ